jgi:hypothetical protein
MTDGQKAAYVIAQSVTAMVTAMGMHAANQQHPEDQPYGEDDFKNAPGMNCISHDASLGLFLDA